ncbi:3-oxoacyl-[acyl-carrier-protein] synthase II [Desulfonatronum thiosulfatophilum]|uniref:3-oxoacyl-[acyl-carrier-protein] synthase 2 n=1 Tax=Desulfonatronum thiosulfatophilum TaxID=617002 RepID=A0A1G6DY04_9BACT|nr:beta-ketoacyl-ACP synthase II [Desulfonatronum thiosulfatophilum]SDB49645.1 3-oxoacyl-[acyl-carrier-protein] synthase II [Desulfonatronum thiosulfatophilum]
MSKKQIVVTGLSALTPLGVDLQTSWERLLKGESGIGPMTRFDVQEHATKISGEVKGFDPEKYMPVKQTRRMELFAQFAVAGAKMLLENARWEIPADLAHRTAVIIGCGIGGLDALERSQTLMLSGGPRKVSPFFIPSLIANMASGQVSIFTGAKGNNVVTTSACASGLHAIGTAYSELLLGRADVAICGGTEASLTPLALAGFNALRALSTRNDDPLTASRPFENNRDGFVMGEGCGLLLLETLEHAKARGATILAEVVGYGASSDAYHITAPHEDGEGMALAMRAALDEAGIPPEELDHINAHGTSTKLNDITETRAIKTVFGKHASSIPITANKSMIGHLLGAAGGVESVFSVMTLHHGVIPGTINMVEPDPECDLDYVTDGSRKAQVRYVLCNSFGFGGTNATIMFKRWEG